MYKSQIYKNSDIYRYIYLARAKRDTLDNIKSLLKHNIKSRTDKQQRQQER